jgi:hypothetical protein
MIAPLLANSVSASSGILVAMFLGVVVAAIGLFVVLWDWDLRATWRRRGSRSRRRTIRFLENERDLAAALGIDPRYWIWSRFGLVVASLAFALWTGIWLLFIAGPILAWTGIRFALSGRGNARRLRRERAFINQLRNLRDRMAISNQSLDTALQELGRRPGAELEYVFEPLTRGGSVVENIVDTGRRSRSPIIEYACGVLLWSRTRSLDSLIEAIAEVLIPVSEAQLAVQEEAQATLAQQRAVTFAMSGLLVVVFMAIVRVDTFASYYRSATGNVVLAIVILMFFFLVWTLGVIVKVSPWTRWNLRRLADEQERLNA